MDRTFAIVGSLSACWAVAAGAFGAHALRARLAPDALAVFETAARYQMYHALALIAVALLLGRAAPPVPWLRAAGWLFVAGTVAFSGSLYLLSLTGTRWWGAVTPAGGLCFLAGWLALTVGLARTP